MIEFCMRIIHRFTVENSAKNRRDLETIGIDIEAYLVQSMPYLAHIEMKADDPRITVVRTICGSGIHQSWTEFSGEECASARNLKMSPKWQRGFPMPSGDFEYRKRVYDLSDYCELCGMGFRQIAPFSLRGEPIWGKRSVFKLFWETHATFVKREAYDSVFRKFGVNAWPVTHFRSGKELGGVVQLKIDQFVPQHLGESNRPQLCHRCGRIRYLGSAEGIIANIGFEPAPMDTEAALFQSEQWYGDGYKSFRQTFVNNQLYQEIQAAKLNVVFAPCA